MYLRMMPRSKRSAPPIRSPANSPFSQSLYTTAVHTPRRAATIFAVIKHSCGPGSGGNSRTIAPIAPAPVATAAEDTAWLERVSA
jgi:hypothetical protein